ncbi:MAG: LysM peptidoglycan-binding domain-containing protein [Opitutaceae bacterium]|nr:LysM peptidoglycan-binding domain-containing protein [Opitutaceae bacterium]
MRTHTVVAGDTLSRLAKDYYGSVERWPEIYEANREALKNPASLDLGMELIIP